MMRLCIVWNQYYAPHTGNQPYVPWPDYCDASALFGLLNIIFDDIDAVGDIYGIKVSGMKIVWK